MKPEKLLSPLKVHATFKLQKVCKDIFKKVIHESSGLIQAFWRNKFMCFFSNIGVFIYMYVYI